MTELKPRLPIIEVPGMRDLVAGPRRSASHRGTWQRRYRMRLLVTDTSVVFLAVVLGYLLRFGFTDAGEDIAGVHNGYSVLLPLVAATWLLALSLAHTRDTRVLGLGSTEYKRVITASWFTFGLIAIVLLVTKTDVARGYFVVALPVGTLGLLTGRWAWRNWLIAQRRHGDFLARAIVTGHPADARYVIEQIDLKPGTAYNVVGAALYEGHEETLGVAGREVPVLSTTLDGVAAAAARSGAQAVIVAGQPRADSDFIQALSWRLEGTATELVLAARLVDVAGPRIHFRPIEGLPLIQVEIPQFDGGKHVLKRALDVALSAALLALLAIPMLVIGILVRCDSRGPALFRQQRVGRGGEMFSMLKFRSMVVDAEERLDRLRERNDGSGPLFKMKDDPRVTRMGRWLRKFSLDELPQLWNVFVGDMSLVGPRPPLAQEVADYDGHVGRRLYIKPGLTGMWQVNGRSDLSWDESVHLDLYYVENWSVVGDLILLWRTVKVVIKAKGAY